MKIRFEMNATYIGNVGTWYHGLYGDGRRAHALGKDLWAQDGIKPAHLRLCKAWFARCDCCKRLFWCIRYDGAGGTGGLYSPLHFFPDKMLKQFLVWTLVTEFPREPRKMLYLSQAHLLEISFRHSSISDLVTRVFRTYCNNPSERMVSRISILKS